MNLSKQIKALRSRDGLSQEALAERIYVSRQTISNWETERSYPDVQSLLLLSVLFNVSIDDLVKGDIDMMRTELDTSKMNVWSWVMIICIVLGPLSLIPMYGFFGLVGLIPSAILIVIALAASIVLERFKKKHNIKTYSEIVAFMDGTPIDEEKVAREREHSKRTFALKILGGAVFGLLIMLASGFLYKLIAG